MMTQELRDRLVSDDGMHRALLEYCRRRITAAERRWGQRHTAWREAEWLYRAYREEDDDDWKTRRQSLTAGVKKIVVPYSYSVVQSMVAFFMTILTERLPMVPVRGAGPADVQAAQLMEEVLHDQMARMDPPFILVLYQLLLDAHRYGVGVVKCLYTIREWVDVVRRFQESVDPFTGMRTMEDTIVEEDVIAYEGNECANVSPYDFLPDPARPFGEFQRGEFVWHKLRRSRVELSQKEAEGLYVGVDKLQSGRLREDGTTVGQSSDLARLADMSSVDEDDPLDVDNKPYVTIHEGYCWLHGSELVRLGLAPAPSATPRLWVLTIANKDRVLRAEPANLPGRRFPFEVFEPNYDIHSPANVGVIESIRGLQYHLSWLFNARMTAVRRTLNNELVIDPAMIELADLKDPAPGRLLRLTRAAQNSGLIDKAVFPLPVVDVTQNHPQDAKVVQELAEQVTGASRLLMGLPNTGRRSASEVQGQLSLSSGRMKMLAEIFVSQCGRPLVQSMIRNTQVFMIESLNLRVREELAGVIGAQDISVTPQMLQGRFTIPWLEGGLPSDKLLEANSLRELITAGMQSGAAAPILQQMNWLALYVRFLNVLGIRNVQDFLGPPPQMQVMPDEQVQQQMQAGNLEPAMNPDFSGDGYGQYPNAAAPNAAV